MKSRSLIPALVASALLCAATAQAQGDESTGSTPATRSPTVVTRVESALTRAAHATARGIERGVKAAAHGIEVGVRAAARGVERGAQATARAAQTVADKVAPESN